MSAIGHPTAAVDVARSTFLIVDEKPAFREIAHNALSHCRVRDVKSAPGVLEALQILKRIGANVGGLICDWDLAPLGGLELLRRIRTGNASRTPRDLRAVIFTARPDAAAVKAAMQMDVGGFAAAPLAVDKLVKIIDQALQRPFVLRPVEHYAAIPPVAVPARTPEKNFQPVRLPAAAQKAAAESVVAAASKQATPTSPRVAPDSLANVRMCTLAQVEPGVVLARDLNDRDGHLLLKAGAPLNAALLGRLSDIAGGHVDSYHVWVGDRRAV